MNVPVIVYDFSVTCTATAKVEGHRPVKATGNGSTVEEAKRAAQRALEPKVKTAQRKVLERRRKKGG